MNRRIVDFKANRQARKWTWREQLGRCLWGIFYPVFRLSPRPYFWGWRRFTLRLFGAKIGRDVHIHPTVRIAVPWNVEVGQGASLGDRAVLYSLGPISIGAGATVSQGAHICAGTHDWRDSQMPLLKLPIRIGADTWICADAFIGPGVTIGDGAIVGARAVAMKDVSPYTIVIGNPARVVGRRDT